MLKSIARKEIHDEALRLRSEGFVPLPMNPESKAPYIHWKQYQGKLPSEGEVKGYMGAYPTCNLGIITGKLAGIIVVDVDGEEGITTFKRLGIDTNSVPLVKTGKGYHLYYKFPDNGRVSNFQQREGLTGIDLRAEGGCIIVPPSTHENGNKYKWLRPLSRQLQDLPQAILAQSPKEKAPIKKLYNGTTEGNRNQTLAKLVGSWVNDNLTFQECIENAQIWNSKNETQLSEQEIETTIKSILTKHEREKNPTFENCTDLGNSRRLVTKCGDIIRYCYPWRKWLIWNGKKGIWQIDAGEKIKKLAKKVVKSIHFEAGNAIDKEETRKLSNWALKSESSKYIEYMIELAKSEDNVPISPEEMDTNL